MTLQPFEFLCTGREYTKVSNMNTKEFRNWRKTYLLLLLPADPLAVLLPVPGAPGGTGLAKGLFC